MALQTSGWFLAGEISASNPQWLREGQGEEVRAREGKKNIFKFLPLPVYLPLDPEAPGSCLFRGSSAKSDILLLAALDRAAPASLVQGG